MPPAWGTSPDRPLAHSRTNRVPGATAVARHQDSRRAGRLNNKADPRSDEVHVRRQPEVRVTRNQSPVVLEPVDAVEPPTDPSPNLAVVENEISCVGAEELTSGTYRWARRPTPTIAALEK